jgi:hypothetical protein
MCQHAPHHTTEVVLGDVVSNIFSRMGIPHSIGQVVVTKITCSQQEKPPNVG